MKADIRSWCKHCQSCQANKINRHTRAPIGTLPNRGKFKVIHIDLVGPLPEVSGKKFLFTMIDRETCWTEAIALREIGSKNITDILKNEWISRYGAPEIIISDNGRQFISNDFSQFVTHLESSIGTQRPITHNAMGRSKDFTEPSKTLCAPKPRMPSARGSPAYQ